MCSYFIDHLEDNDLLTEFQNGFRKKHGTVDAVFKFLMIITKNLDNRIPTLSTLFFSNNLLNGLKTI